MKIKLIEFGIASRIGNIIYINKKIKEEHPVLYKSILLHEKAHSSGFSVSDLMLDINGKYLKGVKKEYWKFVIKNPKSLVQFLPCWKYDNTIVFDPVMVLLWFITGLLLIWVIK